MSIPDYQSFMLPLLKLSKDGAEHSMKDTYNKLAEEFELTNDERNELLPSGTQKVYKNRIGWARTYLKKAGLLESKKRGYFNITEKGQKILHQNIENIDNTFLKQFKEFKEFQNKSNKNIEKQNKEDAIEKPE